MMTTALGSQTRGGIVYAARIGYAAKGLVYAVLGVLALLAAFGEGGRLTDSKGAVEAIGSQPFGTFLLWAVAVGMVCYAGWNAIRAALDPEHKGSEPKGIAKRIGYGFSAVVHFGLALYAAQLAYGSGSSSGGTQTWVAKLLDLPFGAVLVGIAGAVAIFFGATQIFKAAKGRVGEQYANAPLAPNVRRISRRIARVGVFARGLVFPVIGFSLLVAAWKHDPGQADGFGEALSTFARQPFGAFLLTFVAAGLLAYGVHLFFVARYGRLPAPH
jgi:hypothetical protein